METSANVTECFPSLFLENDFDSSTEEQPCSFTTQDGEDDWQEELEQFWDDRKHRIVTEFEQTQQLSSSIEKHLLFDECIQEPEDEIIEPQDDSRLIEESNTIVLNGADIDDIPTHYSISGFQPHELIVIGTYIDTRVIPGFRYKVRKNQTEKYLFHGKALRLDQIGQGYGKRLTFESPSLNKNCNYFWSDSCAAGFAFSAQAIDAEDIFNIFDPALKIYVGKVVISSVEEQTEKATVFEAEGRVEKLVSVKFHCSVYLTYQGNNQSLENISTSGTAILIKENRSAIAEIERIKLDEFVVDNYELHPIN